ncbi:MULTISPECIES: substrate-binding periplasmic protein [unclassified Arsukibacterium]|uniref:substrate-binding periplasmic protein n=1 Tax=unclassified Arsukibacterium TaxID=2635278 RepID=UPI000C4D573F|nr:MULTISPECIES: transporter substrate-binding domain-containing protein [unclassified Arsukibacterium]MAA93150.1 polar amino acid ABC transporter [Rheinheimera sp.]MBM33724.1 polar amino acid ABC transporter [Rheinheimera sp.]HAW91444.1 polar amino acid ABC transporter [Candidatus Azambacteria bacterium]|tara:strand:- start:25469 stop:26176 length:708 start_codon:yes stop_codon:yes gene_type:complete
MRLILLFIFTFSWQLCATPTTLKVAVNIGPPWAFYQEEKGITGIDVEIIRHILTNMGYDSEFHLLAYNRLIKEFNEGKFDVASPAAFPPDNGYLTTPYLPFADVVVSLEYNKYNINTLADLKGKNIIAYQFATSVLGQEFADVVKDENYLEIAERELQLKLLVNARTDVVIGERRLLTYIMQKNHPGERLTIHPIFITKPYGAIFKDQLLQQQFDQELEKLQQSGGYQAILNNWP